MYFTVSSDDAGAEENRAGDDSGANDEIITCDGRASDTGDRKSLGATLAVPMNKGDGTGVGDGGRWGGPGGWGELGGARSYESRGDVPGRLTVVSNDEMRNHRMALLEPVPFKR